MSRAAALLDRLGRPGAIRLGTAHATGPARLPTGLPGLDALLGGGLPRGSISEVSGRRSAGRTGLACAVAAAATARGEVIAWVDPDEALDPEAATTAGIRLERMLWVRPRHPGDALPAAELLLGAGGFGLVVLDLAGSAPPGLPRGAAAGRAWARLAQAAERTRSTLLVVGAARQAGAFAALGLDLGPHRARWSGGRGRLLLLDGVTARVTVARSRAGGLGRALVVRHAACA